MKRHRVYIFVLLFALIMPLVSCSGAETPVISEFPPVNTPVSNNGTETPASPTEEQASTQEGRTLTIRMNGMLSEKNTPIYEYIQDYEQLHPDVTIVLDYTACGLFFTDLIPGVGNSKIYESQLRYIPKDIAGNSPADIYAVTDYTYLQNLNKNGELADIGEMMQNDADFVMNDYFGNVFDALTFNGELNYFPLGFSIDYVLVNKSFLGLMENSVGEPMNFREMAGMYERLRETYPPDNRPFFWDQGNYFTTFRCAMDINSMDIINQTVSFNTPEIIELLKKLPLLPLPDKEYITQPENIYLSPPPMEQSFLFIFNESKLSTKPYGDRTDKSVFEMYSGVATDYSIWLPYSKAAFTNPVAFANLDGSISFHSNSVFAIHDMSANKDLAWDFLKFCAAEKRADMETGEMSGLYSVDEFPINRYNLKKSAAYELGRVYDKNEKNDIYIEGKKEALISDGVDRLEAMASSGNHFSQVFTLDTYRAMMQDSLRKIAAFLGADAGSLGADGGTLQEELVRAEKKLLDLMNR